MKKIVIFTISVLVLGVVAMYSCVANSKRIEQEKNKETLAVTNQEEIQENVVEETETKNEVIENVAINEEKVEDQEIPQEQIVETKKEVSDNVSNKTTSVSKNQSSKVNTKKQEDKDTEVQVNQKQPETEKTTIQESKSNNVITTKKEEPKSNNVATTKKEELKRNDKMIETIRNVIRKNETEDMKNFGYKIVVDSSIKQLTNQFTYSENRVRNYLRNKFGTIRIYAEDYYCNGEFVMTECYII